MKASGLLCVLLAAPTFIWAQASAQQTDPIETDSISIWHYADSLHDCSDGK